MATLEDLDDVERELRDDGDKAGQNGDAEMKDAEPAARDPLIEEIESLSTQEVTARRKLLENNSRVMRSEFQRLTHEKTTMAEKIKDNAEKIENNRHVLMIC